MIVRRLLSYASFALTGLGLWFALQGCWANLLAMFFAGPASLLALIVIAMLVASPPQGMRRRMREAQIAFGFSTAVLLLAASGITNGGAGVC